MPTDYDAAARRDSPSHRRHDDAGAAPAAGGESLCAHRRPMTRRSPNWFAGALGNTAPRFPFRRRPPDRGIALRRKSASMGCLLLHAGGAVRRRQFARRRASSFPTTISTTPTRPTNASPNSIRRAPRLAPSSSTPIPAASPKATASSMPTARRSLAIRSPRSAALWRSTVRSMRKQRAPSPRFSPKSSSRPPRPRKPSPSSARRKISVC